MNENTGTDSSTSKPPGLEVGKQDGAGNHETDGLPIPADASVSESKPAPVQAEISKPEIDAVDDGRSTKETDGARSDSEAETIVLPDKEYAAQHKTGRAIKHEDDDAVAATSIPDADTEMNDAPAPEPIESSEAHADNGKKKKLPKDGEFPSQDGGNSSGLSSIPSSPVARTQSSRRDDSDSDRSRSSPPNDSSERSKASSKENRKRKLSGNVQPGDRGSGELKRKKSVDVDDSKDRRGVRSSTHGPPRRNSEDRSSSPRARSHRRAASTQSASHPSVNGPIHKKRKVPPALHTSRDTRLSEDIHSDSSSLGDASHPYHHHKRSTPGDASALSSIKMPHKKHRDQIGRTFLARACANREIDNARTRLKERPEDLDVADNAGNTPLQIAALEGCAEIVQILLEAGCDVNCKNNEKDTPLIDAVENGHLEVVKLLLGAGADPRQGNLNGEEPLDLLDAEDENYRPIKNALNAAKHKTNPRRQSEDQAGHGLVSSKDARPASRAPSAASPRDSPPVSTPRSPPTFNLPPRRRTVRSEITRNDLLWMKPTPENLRDRAGKGDMAGVGTILNVLPQADTESLIAAARGGHDEVIQLLLGMGNADPDPKPLRSNQYKQGYNTPMLAAIGRGNEQVLQLLLAQPNFDPTRRDYRGSTYFDIAKERQGFNWEKEFEILKEAYDKYASKGRKNHHHHGSPSKATSSQDPIRKHRDQQEKERESKHRPHAECPPNGPSHRTSFTHGHEGDGIRKKPSAALETKHRTESGKEGVRLHKRLVRPEGRRDSSEAVSDRESTPLGPPKIKPPKTARTESEPSGHADVPKKPRRKLVSGKALKSDQERKRRASVLSSTSSSSSGKERRGSFEGKDRPRLGPKRPEKKPEKKPKSSQAGPSESTVPHLKASASDSDIPNNQHIAKDSVKREDSRDRLSVVRGEAGVKRHRSSHSPQRSRSQEREARRSHSDEASKKRRRIETATRNPTEKSSEHQPLANTSLQVGPAKVANMIVSKEDRPRSELADNSQVDPVHAHNEQKPAEKAAPKGTITANETTQHKSTDHPTSEATKVEAHQSTTGTKEPKANQPKPKASEPDATNKAVSERSPPRPSDSNAQQAHSGTDEHRKAEAERQNTEKERRKAEEERRKAEDDQHKVEEEQRKVEEEQRKLQEEKRKVEEEKRKVEEEQRSAEQQKRKAEEDKRKAEEEKRKAEEEKRKAEEEIRKVEEDRVRAEKARQKAEEERKRADVERERQARLDREAKEEAERKARIAQEEEQARLEEQKRVREIEHQARVAREEEEAREERKRREEEAQRRHAEQERLRRIDQERKRAEHEERQRQMEMERQEDEERRRRQALPNCLCRAAELSVSEARNPDEVNRWLPLYTATTRQLEPNCESDVANDEWIANFQAAPILGIKDLELSQYTAWAKKPFTLHHRTCMWNITRRMLAEAFRPPSSPKMVVPTLLNATLDDLAVMHKESRPKFFAMKHVFWIKLSDFMDIKPRYPHLLGVHIRTWPATMDSNDRPRVGVFPSPSDRQLPNGVIHMQNGVAEGNATFRDSSFLPGPSPQVNGVGVAASNGHNSSG